MDTIASNLNGITKDVMNGATVITNSLNVDNTTTWIVAIIVGLIVCLFGLKLFRVLTALAGVLIGAAVGTGVAAAFSLNGVVVAVVMAACAAVMGALAFFLYKFGVFVTVLSYASVTMAMLLNSDTMIKAALCIIVGVIFAILAVVFMEPILILVTGIEGGICAGMAISFLTGIGQNAWWGYGIGIVLSVAGIIVQFMMHSRKIGKKEVVYSSKVKEEVSRESEVEKARKLLEEEEEEE